ncbi:hypothetical protein HXX76_016097 [Chlamydomonas incerta]|uniref:Uncharacterized protein n=1 Tax=Chlamydomonas incerta TaxID=51695 RepID=A0A835SFC1_CHLIN|nr:hypothetical protein HXX76_016097 [Chlamydomonas incerta]|eukprot:KAG2422373.1 hypothetical protein HXX76_016097 [Chlamydomonas incerta]
MQAPARSIRSDGPRKGVAPRRAGRTQPVSAPHLLAAVAPAPSPLTPSGAPRQPNPLSSPQRAPGSGSASFSQLPSWVPQAAATATLERGAVDTSLTRYRRHSKAGAVVDATCEARDGKVIVRVTASYVNVPHAAPSELQLHWGMFRASGTKWHHPKEAVPPDSALEQGGAGAMRTPMTWDGRAGPGGEGAWVVRFEVPAKLAPLHLAFSLYQPAADKYDTPVRAPHFAVPVGMSAGSPEPLGASVVAVSHAGGFTGLNGHHGGGGDPREATCAVNFAAFSRHASSLQLCLVRLDSAEAPGGGGAPLVAQSVLEVVLDPLTNRTGDVWHVCVHGLKDLETLCWAWRADGEVLWQNGNRFHPGFMLMDPHATRAVPVLLPPGAHKAAPRMAPSLDAGEPVLLGSLAAFVHAPFDWQGHHQAMRGGQSRVRALEDSVVVEVDVARFTTGRDAEATVPPEHRGKYLGILDRVDALKAAGATTVMLSPVCLSAPGPSPAAGRSPLGLMAPDPAFAVGGPLAAAAELKAVIRGLHAAGLEVLLQVEFCVTAEGGDAGAGRLQGLRGLDHAVYYREGLEAPVLNCGHPVVRQLVLSALRHWASEYRVEGFCFLNAENLTQDKFGAVLDAPPLAEDIAGDPVLRDLKLVAAVSNPALLPRLAERGFPHWGVWQQVNDRYASDLCSYLVNCQRGLLSAVATRLTGSADLFAPRWDAGLPGGLAAGRRAGFGLNVVGPLGDVPLGDVIDSDNVVRGDALARSLLVAQFVSAGQPLLAATNLSRPGVPQLLAALAAVRRGYRSLICPASITAPEREVAWHSPYGGGEPDWSGSNPDPAANCVLLTLSGGPSRPGHMLAAGFNPNGEPVSVTLPRPPAGAVWRLLVDTSRPVPTATAGGASLGAVLPPSEQTHFTLGPYGSVLLDAVPQGGAVAGGPGPAAAVATPRPGPSAAARMQ